MVYEMIKHMYYPILANKTPWMQKLDFSQILYSVLHYAGTKDVMQGKLFQKCIHIFCTAGYCLWALM